MNYSIMTERETEIELSTSVSEGLTSFTAHDRLIDNGRNMPEKKYAKSIFAVVLSQLKNLYTLAFIVMGIITALFDFEQGRGAWMIFFAVAAINVVSGFLRDNRDRKIALDFDEKRGEEVKIIRDGKLVMSEPTILVKGDIVVLKEGDFVPADLRILQCENLKVDESFFKERNIPVDKVSERADFECDEDDAPNMLYSGSRVVQGEAVGAIVRTGKETLLAKTVGNKSKKLDMHNKFARSAESEKLLVCAALIMAMIVMVFVTVTEKNFNLAMIKACTVALCLLPAPVCIVRLLAIRFSKMELERAGVKLQKDDSAFEVGMSEYFLFDKGGILTNGTVELEDRVFSGRDKLGMAVICSDCEFDGDNLKGSSIDLATAKAFIEDGFDVKKIIEDNKKILFMPYDEQRGMMATLIKNESGYRLIIKGSVEVVPTLCAYLADGDEIFEMSGEIMHRLETISSSMAERGLKIRAVAYRDIDYIPENIEDEIKAMTFVGALGYREVMARKARETVKKIESVYIKPVMVTGDLTITAAVVAKQAGLIKRESQCISFRELGDCTDEELISAVNRYKVFTGATKADRERLVKVLEKSGARVAVAGDQMTLPTVAINANASIGSDENCNVKLENADMKSVGDVLYKTRAMRGNIAYASLLAIGTGVAEALVLMYMLFTGSELFPVSYEMLATNLFVVFVPCLMVSLLASVHCRVGDVKTLAMQSLLHGFIAALLCMKSNMIMYFIFYALFEAFRMCVSFNNLEKGKKGGIAIIVAVCVFIGIIIGANSSFGVLTNVKMAGTILCALLTVILNAVLSKLKLKGRNSSDV